MCIAHAVQLTMAFEQYVLRRRDVLLLRPSLTRALIGSIACAVTLQCRTPRTKVVQQLHNAYKE